MTSRKPKYLGANLRKGFKHYWMILANEFIQAIAGMYVCVILKKLAQLLAHTLEWLLMYSYNEVLKNAQKRSLGPDLACILLFRVRYIDLDSFVFVKEFANESSV